MASRKDGNPELVRFDHPRQDGNIATMFRTTEIKNLDGLRARVTKLLAYGIQRWKTHPDKPSVL